MTQGLYGGSSQGAGPLEDGLARRRRRRSARISERRLDSMQDPEQGLSWLCPVCQQPSHNVVFCPDCGEELVQIEYDDTSHVHGRMALKDWLAMGAIAGTILVVFGFFAFLFYVRMHGWPW